ncbi:MAG: hypothetical protein EBS29_07435, partial [Chloroflexia bacterium]|nr:hypothetical protein [Chloroflexia bacterium]
HELEGLHEFVEALEGSTPDFPVFEHICSESERESDVFQFFEAQGIAIANHPYDLEADGVGADVYGGEFHVRQVSVRIRGHALEWRVRVGKPFVGTEVDLEMAKARSYLARYFEMPF